MSLQRFPRNKLCQFPCFISNAAALLHTITSRTIRQKWVQDTYKEGTGKECNGGGWEMYGAGQFTLDHSEKLGILGWPGSLRRWGSGFWIGVVVFGVSMLGCVHTAALLVFWGVASWQYLTLTRNVRSDCKLVQPTLYQNWTLIDTKLEIIVLWYHPGAWAWCIRTSCHLAQFWHL